MKFVDWFTFTVADDGVRVIDFSVVAVVVVELEELPPQASSVAMATRAAIVAAGAIQPRDFVCDCIDSRIFPRTAAASGPSSVARCLQGAATRYANQPGRHKAWR